MSKFSPSLLLLLLLHCTAHAQTAQPLLNEAELTWLGEQIFANECMRQVQCLTSWNQGETFPSLGIGHFIWYRADQQEPFQETFPALLSFMRQQGLALPGWLQQVNYEQPWPDRESFLAARETAELTELRTFLLDNMAVQTAFIVQRFTAGLEPVLNSAPPAQQAELRQKTTSIVEQGGIKGIYALIDYVHFKGEGTAAAERYAGQGWGLLQVLQNMPADSAAPLQSFVLSANEILARRVAAAPPERNEQRWLAGWQNRLATYLPED